MHTMCVLLLVQLLGTVPQKSRQVETLHFRNFSDLREQMKMASPLEISAFFSYQFIEFVVRTWLYLDLQFIMT